MQGGLKEVVLFGEQQRTKITYWECVYTKALPTVTVGSDVMRGGYSGMPCIDLAMVHGSARHGSAHRHIELLAGWRSVRRGCSI